MHDFFDRIYIINLAHRTDRWGEMREELNRIGIDPEHPRVQRFDAVRPADAGEFPTIGTRGCFMSHLGVLQDAMQAGHQRILVLEDDLDFSADFVARWPGISAELSQRQWQVFYGSYEIPPPATLRLHSPMTLAPAETPVKLAAFVAFQGAAIATCEQYLRDMLQRPAGSPEGGPMHVDGAYTWLRHARPEWLTLLAEPQLGRQRPSRTDIHALPWYDQMTGVRDVAQWARRMKRKVAGRA